MSEIADTVTEAVETAEKKASRLNTAVAALVALSATFMALCNVKDGNVVQAMAQAQATGVDQWAFFQAKSTKQSLAETAADQLAVQRDATPNLLPEARALYDRKIAEYLAHARQYEAEKAKIKADAEAAAKEYDRLNVHDDQFDMAEASLSVAIALFGVTALTQKRWLLAFGVVVAAFGAVLGVAGFLGKNLHPDWLAKLLS
jgi:hypothetical protein